MTGHNAWLSVAAIRERMMLLEQRLASTMLTPARPAFARTSPLPPDASGSDGATPTTAPEVPDPNGEDWIDLED